MSALVTLIAVLALLVAIAVLRMRRAGRLFETILADEAEVTRQQDIEPGGRHRLSA